MNLMYPETLPDEVRQSIAVQSIEAKTLLFQQGEQADYLYIITQGRLRLMRYLDDGKTVTFQIAQPGDGVAEVVLMADFYPCTAVAEVDSQVIAYPKQVILNSFRNYPDLTEHLIHILLRKIESLKFRLELRDIRAAHERVLQYLRQLAAPNSSVITVDRPFKDVAADLGITPETLSRALSRLEQDGAITRMQQYITLNDSPAA